MTSGSTQPSAELLRTKNKFKAEVSENNLWDEQQQALNKLLTKSDSGGILNLIGKPNSGKTYLAYYVVQQFDGWEYYPWYSAINTINSENLIVDNVTASRDVSRRLRELRTFDGAHSVVAITEKPLPEATYLIHLE